MNEKQIKMGNRISGLGWMVFGDLIFLGTDNPFVRAGAAGIILDGAGSLVSGKQHYFWEPVLKYYFPGLGAKNEKRFITNNKNSRRN